MLRCMTGREMGFHDKGTKFENISIVNGIMFESIRSTSLCTNIQPCRTAKPIYQLPGSAHKVGVNVGLKHMGNAHAPLPGHLQIYLNIRSGIDHCCYTGAVVS